MPGRFKRGPRMTHELTGPSQPAPRRPYLRAVGPRLRLLLLAVCVVYSYVVAICVLVQHCCTPLLWRVVLMLQSRVLCPYHSLACYAGCWYYSHVCCARTTVTCVVLILRCYGVCDVLIVCSGVAA